MIVGKAIYNILSTDTDVAALVGTRIYPNIVEQEKVDQAAVIYKVDNTAPTNTKDGASTVDIIRVYVFALAEGYDACHNLSEKVRVALDRKKGTFAGVVVDSIIFDSRDDDDYDADLNKHYVSNVYSIRVKR
jgi:hypothetical protein